jgi:hypothetical protein
MVGDKEDGNLGGETQPAGPFSLPEGVFGPPPVVAVGLVEEPHHRYCCCSTRSVADGVPILEKYVERVAVGRP